MRKAPAPGASGATDGGRDVTIIAEGLSKQYPGRPAQMFPPVVSIFDRNLNPFNRKSWLAVDESRRAGIRTRADDEEDDEEEEEDEDEEDFDAIPEIPGRPEETFWAVKDVSFRLEAGRGLGVVGGPDAGKSTLLRIIGGQATPTEGRVFVRDPVAPLPAGLARGINLSGKGTFNADLVFGGRLLGVPARLMKAHRKEIEDLAQPLVTADGDAAPGAMLRLSVAAAAVLPSRLILLEEPLGEADFTARIVERLRARLDEGASLILASRKPELVASLCDEVLVLESGVVVDRGRAESASARYEAGRADTRRAGTATGDAAATGETVSRVWNGRKLRVPAVVTPFHSGVALLGVELRAATGRAGAKRIDAGGELHVEVEIETGVPDVVVQCDVAFTPPKGGGPRVRLDLPEPQQCGEPGTYRFVAQIPPGSLEPGPYDLRVDALVSNAADRGTSVIGRDGGRIKLAGGAHGAYELAEEPAEHWDGRPAWRIPAEWSAESG